MHSRWERMKDSEQAWKETKVPRDSTFCVQSGSSPGSNELNELLHPVREGDSLMLQMLLIGSQLHLFT